MEKDCIDIFSKNDGTRFLNINSLWNTISSEPYFQNESFVFSEIDKLMSPILENRASLSIKSVNLQDYNTKNAILYYRSFDFKRATDIDEPYSIAGLLGAMNKREAFSGAVFILKYLQSGSACKYSSFVDYVNINEAPLVNNEYKQALLPQLPNIFFSNHILNASFLPSETNDKTLQSVIGGLGTYRGLRVNYDYESTINTNIRRIIPIYTPYPDLSKLDPVNAKGFFRTFQLSDNNNNFSASNIEKWQSFLGPFAFELSIAISYNGSQTGTEVGTNFKGINDSLSTKIERVWFEPINNQLIANDQFVTDFYTASGLTP